MKITIKAPAKFVFTATLLALCSTPANSGILSAIAMQRAQEHQAQWQAACMVKHPALSPEQCEQWRLSIAQEFQTAQSMAQFGAAMRAFSNAIPEYHPVQVPQVPLYNPQPLPGPNSCLTQRSGGGFMTQCQ
jgi:hypothetical protein